MTCPRSSFTALRFNVICLLLSLVATLVATSSAVAQSAAGNIPLEWQTTAEKTDYKKTSTYDEAVAYSKKLARASGGLITYTTYGKSGEGRDLPLLIAASGGAG